jgi:hypothetical protein
MTSVLWVKGAGEGGEGSRRLLTTPFVPPTLARALTRRAVCSFYGTAENGFGRVSVPLSPFCVLPRRARKTRGTLTFVYLAAGTCAPAI